MNALGGLRVWFLIKLTLKDYKLRLAADTVEVMEADTVEDTVADPVVDTVADTVADTALDRKQWHQEFLPELENTDLSPTMLVLEAKKPKINGLLGLLREDLRGKT